MVKIAIKRLRQYGLKQFTLFALAGLKLRFINRMLLHSYSQFKEDLFLDKLLGNKKYGFYLDVGAYDPKWFSNTYRFYKRGWSGINIEPNIVQFRKIEKVRPRDINLNIGIGLKSSEETYYIMDPPALSTFVTHDNKKRLREDKNIQSKIRVQTKPLREILSRYTKGKIIDFFSLDVEGMELDVLRSNDWTRYRPEYLCIETTSIITDVQPRNNNRKLTSYLFRIGYTLLFDNGLNSIYKRSR